MPRTDSGSLLRFFTGDPDAVASRFDRMTVVHGRHFFSGEGRILRRGDTRADIGDGFEGEKCRTVRGVMVAACD